MGMFDFVRSSYNLGEEFTNVVCHTKDIEEGIGGTMTSYWLDPAGVLWYPDYNGTNTFETIKEDDARYNSNHLFLNFEWIPTGKRGRYYPYNLTKYIEVYPAEWKGEWNDWPRLRLHFRGGVLQDFEDITEQRCNLVLTKDTL